MIENEPVQQSLLAWIVLALGLPYAVMLLLLALLSFVLTLVILVRGKGPMAAAALVLVVHLPLLIGAFGALQGTMSALTVIATSSTAPRPADVAAGVSTAIVVPLVALVLTIPNYLIAAVGAFVRSLNRREQPIPEDG